METSWNVTDYPNPPESKEKLYKFDFIATVKGVGEVYAETLEEAKEYIMERYVDLDFDFRNYNIEEINNLMEG